MGTNFDATLSELGLMHLEEDQTVAENDPLYLAAPKAKNEKKSASVRRRQIVDLPFFATNSIEICLHIQKELYMFTLNPPKDIS